MNILLQAIGYKGEIGYQTFLYSNVVELRKVLMFLIDKLPRETEKTASVPLGDKYSVSSSIENIVFFCLILLINSCILKYLIFA